MVTRKRHFSYVRDRWSDPLLTILTILLLILMFFVTPLDSAGIIAAAGYGFVILLILVAGVAIVSGSSAVALVMLLAVGLISTATALRLVERSILDIYLEASAWAILGIALILVVARAVFGPGPITYHRVVGAVLLYVTIGLTFVALFAFIGLLVPDAFRGLSIADSPALASDLIYFSFVTLTTTGYGDIVPLHPLARSLCNLEGIIGQLYPATLLARLVTLELEGRRR